VLERSRPPPEHCTTRSPVASMKAPGCMTVQGRCKIGRPVGCKRALACCTLGAPERCKTVLELAGCKMELAGCRRARLGPCRSFRSRLN
jgi:hypothetical protein